MLYSVLTLYSIRTSIINHYCVHFARYTLLADNGVVYMPEKKSRSFVTQRRDTIAQMLRDKGSVQVADLADSLGISPLTVRRDLDVLEKEGIAYRRYGEAVLADGNDQPNNESKLRDAAKEAIARSTVDLLHDHSLLFVNTSSTALMAVEHIKADGVTVVTNSVRAQSLPIPPSGMILMTGGEVRPPRGVLSGEFALANIRSVAATACFVGCAGFSLSAGVTSTTQQEATVNSLMVERSDRMILLADSSKMGIGAGFTYAPLDSISLLITDTGLSDENYEALLEAGVQEIRRVSPDSKS